METSENINTNKQQNKHFNQIFDVCVLIIVVVVTKGVQSCVHSAQPEFMYVLFFNMLWNI